MEFNFEEEASKLERANETINRVIENYNDMLAGLSNKERDIILLYNCFNKYDTIKNMNPKGNFTNEQREKSLAKVMELLQRLGNKHYGITDFNTLRDAVMNDMDGKLGEIFWGFPVSIINAYKEHCDHVYTMLPIQGLTELKESEKRENQYLNSIYDGVFSTTTMPSIEKYIARANVDGMIVKGREITYPSNPFSEVDENGCKLIKPVSIYLSNVDYFVPQFDYEIERNGRARFIYGGEWVAPCEKVECVEKQTSYLPASFVERNDVKYYGEHRELVPINIESKRL